MSTDHLALISASLSPTDSQHCGYIFLRLSPKPPPDHREFPWLGLPYYNGLAVSDRSYIISDIDLTVKSPCSHRAYADKITKQVESSSSC